MRTWVKICGTTNVDDARLGVDAGADALGFIFAESPRRISAEAARKISAVLPGGIERIGVFVNAAPESVLETARHAGMSGVQLHGDESPEYVKQLRRLAGEIKLRIIKAIPAHASSSFGLGSFEGGEDSVDAIMIDSGSWRARGGTGQVFDWSRSGDFILWLKQRAAVIVAGGLRPGNVGAAVARFHPYGVDAVTGVEAAYGKKDPVRVRAFVQAVRDADQARQKIKLGSSGRE